jgi:hypothetical protein
MVDAITIPTRAQIAQLVGNDQRLILAMEALFLAGLDVQNVTANIATLQADVTTLFGETSDNEANIDINEADIDALDIRVTELENSSNIGHAEEVVLSTYGDTVSVAAKAKDLTKFGTNSTVGTSYETVAQFQGTTANETFVSTNAIDAIVSSNAGDTQVIRVEGQTIDGSGNLTFVVQDATLNGQTSVLLGTPLARATRAYVKDSGTFNSPQAALAGVVSVYDNTDGESGGVPTTAAATKLLIEAGFTQSEKCATSVSANDYWFITEFSAGIGDAGGSANRVTFRLESRSVTGGGVWRPFGRVLVVNVDQNGRTFTPVPYLIVPKNSDVRVVAKTNSNTAEVFAEVRGMLAAVQ